MNLNHPSVYKIMVVYTLFLISCLVAVHINGMNFNVKDGVLILTDKNFEGALHTYPRLLVFFHSPSCKGCRELDPEFIEAAKALNESDPNVILAKIDSSTSPETAKKYVVKNYPTLKLITS